MSDNKLLHEILQRLSVVETLQTEHNAQDKLIHDDIKKVLEQMQEKQVALQISDAQLKVKVGLWGGIAGIVSAILTVIMNLV